MNAHPANGIASIPSSASVDQTVEKLQSILKQKDVRVFAVVDHSGEAAKVGMTMRSTKVVIFGNPRGGTPMMQSAPTVAIDLPLKALVWEDAGGQVWITYNTPEYLQQRHHVPPELIKNIEGIAGLLKMAAE